MKSPSVIVEGSSPSFPQLSELWQYRELLYFLAWRDVKVKYKQTALGVLWIVLQPLLTMMIFTFIFGRLVNLFSGDVPYALFALSGLVPWSYFSLTLTYASNSLITNGNLITKVYCPRMILPLATICGGFVDLAIVFFVFLCAYIGYGFAVIWEQSFLPLCFLWVVMVTAGASFWLSALNVNYRDVRHIVPFLIQMLMFVSPIVYPLAIVDPSWIYLYACNPLVGVIEVFRGVMFGPAYPLDGLELPLAISFLSGVFLLVTGARFFHKRERGFADAL